MEARHRLRRTLVAPMLAQRRKPMMIHECRSRQLPTNRNHASLSALKRVTREYQVDSPSQCALLPHTGCIRDGPFNKRSSRKKKIKNKRVVGLTRLVHIRGNPCGCPFVGCPIWRNTLGDPPGRPYIEHVTNTIKSPQGCIFCGAVPLLNCTRRNDRNGPSSCGHGRTYAC